MAAKEVLRGVRGWVDLKIQPAWNYFCPATQCGGTGTNWLQKDLSSNPSSGTHMTLARVYIISLISESRSSKAKSITCSEELLKVLSNIHTAHSTPSINVSSFSTYYYYLLDTYLKYRGPRKPHLEDRMTLSQAYRMSSR